MLATSGSGSTRTCSPTAKTMTQPFTFGWDLDATGKPEIGNGSDSRPFSVGLTSKDLLMRMMRSSSSCILHVDATYKMNYREYPVLSVLQPALMSLHRVFTWVTGNFLQIQFSMSATDKTQQNALNVFFTSWRWFTNVFAGFLRRTRIFGDAGAGLREVGDSIWIGYTCRIYVGAVAHGKILFLATFRDIEWLRGHHNLTDACNALLKRDYTLSRRLKMDAFSRNSVTACPTILVRLAFSGNPGRRMKDLARGKLLGVLGEVGAGGLSAGRVQVFSRPAPRVVVSPKERTEVGIAVSAQMRTNYARMEMEGQAWGGWELCLGFGTCVHVLFAIHTCEHVNSGGHKILMSRKKRRREDGGSDCNGGHALTFRGLGPTR
ncbi:hypothetical protein PHMEG_0003840 [Phytophthora megakarya]|uniref:Uncharacterized protein n=1 Tax=Phytophthora megakarya TaxID=4795 RepID=A0A225WVD0_9STRA|nr:hypothetical protein PHMEG_0003840 [Phytophthora megakarya]